MYKILVIENQLSQFESVCKKLTDDGYVVYPEYPSETDPDDAKKRIYDPTIYNFFMERVMIYLNQENYKGHSDETLQYLKTYIGTRDIDLFIIDYKISGTYDVLTGIDLATELTGNNMFPGTPVIFLSRIPKNTKDLGLNKMLDKRYEWIEKGYSGRSLEDDNYFNLYVKKAIEELLPAKQPAARVSPEMESFVQKIITLLEISVIKDNFLGYFNNLKGQLLFTEEEERLINFLHDRLVDIDGVEEFLGDKVVINKIKATDSFKLYSKNKKVKK